MQNEFYAVAFRKKIYESIEELEKDAINWLHEYNENRTHSGKYYYGKTPMQTFEDAKQLAYDKMIGRGKILAQEQKKDPGMDSSQSKELQTSEGGMCQVK